MVIHDSKSYLALALAWCHKKYLKILYSFNFRSITPKTSSNSKASSPEIGDHSIVDSGRRSQSLEILSDDLRSLTLSTSTPSSPSPRPPASSNLSDVGKISGSSRGHVHFVSGNQTNSASLQSKNDESELG